MRNINVNIITQPSVFVLSRPEFTPHPKYELPPDGAPAERLIATAGKICYDTYGVEGNPVESHVRNLVRVGHYSVTEHAHVGVFIEGISRGLSHEFVRHRHFNYSQRSTRYTEEGAAALVLEPYYAGIWERICKGGPVIREEEELVYSAIDSFARDVDAYQKQIDLLELLNPGKLTGKDLRKWARGKARQSLPNGLETRMVVTGNTSSWRHFFLMRTNRGAEPEIRRLADMLWKVVTPIVPNGYKDLTVGEHDGFIEVTK